MRKRSAGPILFAFFFVLILFSVGAFWLLTAIGLRAITPEGLVSPAQETQIVAIAASDIVDSLSQGRTEQADSAYQQAVRTLGGGSGAYASVAEEIMRRGRPSDAARYLSGAVKDDKDGDINWDPTLWWTLAEAQRKANDPEQAAHSEAEADQRADAIRKTIGQKVQSGSQEVAQREARLLQGAQYFSDDKKDTATALQFLEEAMRIAPDNPWVMNQLGYVLADRGTTTEDFDRAVELTKKALAGLPNEPVVMDSYGWALFKKNDLAGARRVLREAADAEPNLAEIHYHLGVVYGQLGLISDARLELDRALTLKPDYEEAQSAKKRLQLPPGQGVLESA